MNSYNPDRCSAQLINNSASRLHPNIVISRAPLRISFVGGGSDLPPGEGATVSCAINKYVYVVAKWRNDERVIMNWRDKENVKNVHALQHELAREVLLYFGVHQGIEISTFADVPGVGSGLGSSAATTVALVQSVAALTGLWLDVHRLARMAVHIELERLKRRGGSQDQWISAIGGLYLLLHKNGRCIDQTHLGLSPSHLALLERHFALFSPPDTDVGRKADTVLGSKDDNDESFRKCCEKVVDAFGSALKSDDWYECGNQVSQHDKLKRSIFGEYYPRSGPELDKLGVHWKLCGAGGTGHVLVAVRPETRRKTVRSIEKIWGRELPWKISEAGAVIIHAS